MTRIKLYCQGATAWAQVEGDITAGAVGIPIEVECDSAWNGLVRTLVCMSAGKKVPILLRGQVAEVAWETLIEGMHLYLGMEGRDLEGNEVFPTTWADCGVVQPSTEQSHTERPTPTEMEQLLTLAANAMENSVHAIALCQGLEDGQISSEDVRAAVESWLTRHPEAAAAYDDTALWTALQNLETEDIASIRQSLESIWERDNLLLQSVEDKLDLRQGQQNAGKLLGVNEDGIVAPVTLSAEAELPDGVVLAELIEEDEDSNTVEALLLNKLSLESDGEMLWLKFGTQVLGQVEYSSSATVFCTQVDISGGNLTLGVDDTRLLTAQVSPAGCTQPLRWYSSAPYVADVDADGNLTVYSEGTTVITARCGNCQDTVTVTVADTSVTGWTIRSGYALNTGNSVWTTYAQSTRGYAYYQDTASPIPIVGGGTYQITYDDISLDYPALSGIRLNIMTFAGTVRLTSTGNGQGLTGERTYRFTAADNADGLSFNVLIDSVNGQGDTTVANYRAWLEAHIRIRAVELPPIRITAQPQNVTVTEGEYAEFQIGAAGEDLTYQWYYSQSSGSSWTQSTSASGQTAAYGMNAAASMNGRLVRCVVTDQNGNTVTSQQASLTVVSPE